MSISLTSHTYFAEVGVTFRRDYTYTTAKYARHNIARAPAARLHLTSIRVLFTSPASSSLLITTVLGPTLLAGKTVHQEF